MTAPPPHPDASPAPAGSIRAVYLIERTATLALLAAVCLAASGRNFWPMAVLALAALAAARLAAPLWVWAVVGRGGRGPVADALRQDAVESLVLALAVLPGAWPVGALALAGLFALATWAEGRLRPPPSETSAAGLDAATRRMAAEAGVDPDRIVVDPRASVPARLVRCGGKSWILLSPRVVEACTPAEQAVVVAHELGHAAGGDLAWTAAAKVALIAAAALGAGAVGFFTPKAGAVSVAAAVTTLAVLETAGVIALAAMLRATERRAHRWALRTVGDPATFAAAMRKLHALGGASDGRALADVLALAGGHYNGTVL
ncbi:MAG: M48 family metalloprotease [Planctomycetes bacterium]|nr:M48 family metalloprotease [Planctomycetota bacterium]